MPTIKAYQDNILCTDADFGDTVTGAGIIIKSTMGKTDGIVPRWFKVFDTGPKVDWLEVGQWVLVEYGRWTAGIEMKDDRWEGVQEVWKVDPAGCLAVSNEKPQSINLASDAIDSFKKTL